MGRMDRIILDDLRMAERRVVKVLGTSKSKEDVMPIGMRPTSLSRAWLAKSAEGRRTRVPRVT